MALLQAVIAMIGRSAGKILNAIFGWAVHALFGRVGGTERTLLTILVACAALWPLLLVGIAVPRAAAFLLAFVPIPKSVPDTAIRGLWIGLAVALPGAVGFALGAKAPPDAGAEPFWLRVARGYPITLGIAAAFFISFVTIPILRLASAARHHTDANVTVVTDAAAYERVAAEVQRTLNAQGFALVARQPRFWVWAPMAVMRALGGAVLRRYVPERLIHFRGVGLEIAMYPSSLLLRGPAHRTVLAQGLIVEALTPLDAFQTTSPESQAIERDIQTVWRMVDESDEPSRRALRARVREITDELLRLEVSYDDWQTVYRALLQLGRAVSGDPPLLAAAADCEADRQPRRRSPRTEPISLGRALRERG